MAWSQQQSGVLRGMATGAVATFLSLTWAIRANPFGLADQAPLAQRLTLGLAADLGLALWLAGSIGLMARQRFVSTVDLVGSGLSVASQRARILQALLQNNLEQISLAVFVHLLWIVLMPPSSLAAVPMAAALCLLGRLCFSWGYGKGAAARSLGFALSFYSSVWLLVLMAGGLVIRPLWPG